MPSRSEAKAPASVTPLFVTATPETSAGIGRGVGTGVGVDAGAVVAPSCCLLRTRVVLVAYQHGLPEYSIMWLYDDTIRTGDAMATLTDSTLALRAKLFRGLADPSRLALLDALRDGEKTVSDLVVATGLNQSNASGHLACLKDCGLVEARQEWRHVYYRLADGRLETLLALGDGILAATAARIWACLNVPTEGEAAP